MITSRYVWLLGRCGYTCGDTETSGETGDEVPLSHPWALVYGLSFECDVGFAKISPHSSDTLECQSWSGPQEEFVPLGKVTASLFPQDEPREAKEPTRSLTWRRRQTWNGNQNQDPGKTLA